MLEILGRAGPWDENKTAAVIHPYINMGGVPIIAEEENAYLNSHGYKSVLVIPRSSRDALPSGLQRGRMSLGFAETTDHDQFGTQAFWGNTNLRDIIAERNKILALAKTNLINFHEIALYRSAELVGLLRGIPQIWTPDENRITTAFFHASADPEHLKKFDVVGDANKLYKLVDLAFVNTKRAKELYESVFGQEFQILHNPVDTKRFTPDGEKLEGYDDINFNNGKVNIVYLGRLEPRKGLDTALDVINRLVKDERRPKNFRFIIAGGGPDEEDLKKKVRDMGIESHVVFMGRISEEDKPKLYRTADFCYFPAEYGESYGDVLLEAWASGKTTVAGIAFNPEIVAHGNIGYLFKTNKTEEALNYISYLIQHQDLRENMGNAARLTTVSRNDSDKIFGQKDRYIDEKREEKAKKSKRQTTRQYITTTIDVMKGTPSIIKRGIQLENNVLNK
jgi:glycosyltransferase involved in cell wall biosynthesis